MSMRRRIYSFYWRLILVTSNIIFSLSVNHYVFGQTLQVDNTLGNESSVIQPGFVTINGVQSQLIQGGAQRGSNLFHSFTEFNVEQGQGVYFNNHPGVERIISRVTGKNQSKIMGVLGVYQGSADLFLINPNGILFGPKASLDLKGSFLATTADSFIFEDTQYSATEPSSFPLLSVNLPIGLRFRDKPRPITNRSNVTNPELEEPGGLQVKPGEVLALVGGDIFMKGGFLTASDGRIELGSVAGGEVELDASNLTFSYNNVKGFGNIRLSEDAGLITSGQGSGDVNLYGGNITLSGAIIDVGNLGSGPGGNIKIFASKRLLLEGKTSDGFPSILISGSQSSGSSGDISINSNELILRDGAKIQTSPIVLSGPSGDIAATGRAGNISIRTSRLKASGGSSISANTRGNAEGGNISITATDSIQISDDSALSAQSAPVNLSTGNGEAGNITLRTKFLQVTDGGSIKVGSSGSGSAGNLDVNARSILIDNGLLDATTTGAQGNIQLNSNSVILRNGSRISTSANGEANGGNITINTGILLGLGNSDIVANAFEGSGGRIDITAKGIFGFTPLTREQLQQLLGTIDPTQLDPKKLLTSDITAISQSNPSLNGQVNLNTTAPDPNEGLVELPTNVVDPRDLVAQNACRRGAESEFTTSGRGGLPANSNQDLSNDSVQVGLVEPTTMQTSTQTQKQSPTASATPQQTTKQSIAPAQGWVYNEKGEIVLVAYNPSVTSPQRLKDNTACAGQ
jgi:filamentous hemagglutinin family protein